MSLWSGPRALPAALALVAAFGLPGTATAASTVRGHAALQLVSQTDWVVPSQPDGSGTFVLTLSAPGAPAGAVVTAAVYPRLHSRTAFETAVRSGPSGYQLDQTTAIPLATLPADPRDPGSVDLGITVTTSQGAATGQSLDLGCAVTGTAGGTCTGVYPVVVTLERAPTAGGGTLSHFTTFLTYVAGKSPHPLEVAWIVPIAEPPTIRPHAADASRAIAPLPASDAGALEGLVDDLHASAVPVTIEASPQTLQALAAAGPAGRASVATLGEMSTNQALDEIPVEPYVPIDLGALGDGEPTEVAAQMGEGAAVLQKLHVATSPPATWVASGSVGSAIGAGLSDVDATRLVVPTTDLSGPSYDGTGTWASTFQLQLGKSTSVTAAAADSVLTSELADARSDPALAAAQLLADLAMVHFEQPNAPTVRGLVALPPSHWVPNASFDRALLAGLTANPVVTPVTLADYFDTVAASGTRYLQTSGPGPTLPLDVAQRLSRARLTLTYFDSAVPGDPPPPILTELDQLLLAAEDETLHPAARSAALATWRRVFAGQLALVKFATERTVTLTARTGWIPITVVSGAPYTVIGTLSVDGNDRFTFPNRSSQPMSLDHPTNSVRIDVVARSSGDLALTARFVSPSGNLVIASGQLTVRSTATSLVGIVLTAVALGVLLAWWVRTSWSRRRRRRSALRAETHAP